MAQRPVSTRLSQQDPARTAPRQWVLAGLVGVTISVTLCAVVLVEMLPLRLTSLIAIAVGVGSVIAIAPWRQTRVIAEDRAYIAKLARLLDEAVTENRPIPGPILDESRDDAIGSLCRSIRTLCSQSVRSRVENQTLHRRMSDTIEKETDRRTAQLQQQALTDPLTGLANRRALDQKLKEIDSLGRRNREAVSIITIDFDDFKLVNDTLGHDVGDQCLMFLGNVLRAATRSDDLAARLGGDEFVIVTIGQTPAAINAMADRLRALFGQMPWGYDKVKQPSISLGVATKNPADRIDGAELLRQADAALYERKRERIQVSRNAA